MMQFSGWKNRTQAVLSLLVTIGLFYGLTGSAALYQTSWAATSLNGFAPNQYKAGYTYGNGVFYAPHHVIIHSEPKDGSPIVEELYWTSKNNQANYGIASKSHNRYVPAQNSFFCYYPELDVAMMAVIGDYSDNPDDFNAPATWVEVLYDQAAKKSGWVKLASHATAASDTLTSSNTQTESASPSSPLDSSQTAMSSSTSGNETKTSAHVGIYQTWLDFMKFNAKPHGVYWLGGVSSYHRNVRMSDKDEAQFIDVTIIRDMKVKHVRGNWLLVEVMDFQRNTPIGWIRWRDNDGNLMVFPNLSHDKLPVVITGY